MKEAPTEAQRPYLDALDWASEGGAHWVRVIEVESALSVQHDPGPTYRMLRAFRVNGWAEAGSLATHTQRKNRWKITPAGIEALRLPPKAPLT